MAESNGDPSVVNNIGATGLWQILLSAHPDITSAEAKNPVIATRYAIKLWRSEGWQPWEAYTNGMYLTYMHGAVSPDLPDAAPTTCVELDPGGLGGNLERVAWTGGSWPVPLPGFPGESCDPRIIPNVLALVEKYKLFVSDCFAAVGHRAAGEHPLGLAVDVEPGPGGNWDLVDALARWAGWTRSCGAIGVAPVCPLKPVFRFVGYDGYPNHGRGNHLHLSWAHGPGRPATTVTVMKE